MKTKDNVAFGFYSNSLNNNGVRVTGNKLLLSGAFSLNNDQNLPFNFTLVLDDFIAFDADAVLFVKGRIKFFNLKGEQVGTPGAPSIFIAYGKENAKALEESNIEGKFIQLK